MYAEYAFGNFFYPKTQIMQQLRNFMLLSLAILLFTQCKPKTETAVTTTSTPAAAEGLSAQDRTSLMNREAASWEFAKTKQLDKLKEVLADDYQAFFGKITMNKTEVLQSFQQSNITAYRLSNLRVKKISNDVAIVYYDALQNATDPEGDRWVPQISAATTYVKRGGNWYSIFYHETPTMVP